MALAGPSILPHLDKILYQLPIHQIADYVRANKINVNEVFARDYSFGQPVYQSLLHILARPQGEKHQGNARDAALIREILKIEGVNPNLMGPIGVTPLHLAVNCDIAKVDALLSHRDTAPTIKPAPGNRFGFNKTAYEMALERKSDTPEHKKVFDVIDYRNTNVRWDTYSLGFNSPAPGKL